LRILIRKSYDLQVRQAENRRLCGNCYCKDYEGYICINEMGYLLNPNRVSAMFELTLQQNHLRHIRFHDLRHSSASLLLANHVPLKQIQEWLGHSDFSTTANIYAHLDVASKQNTAEAMLHGLGLEEE
jgi:integrase